MNRLASLFLMTFLLALTLHWDAPPNNGYDAPTGYKVYCGPSSGGYSEPVDVGVAMTYQITTAGEYYCAATAYNEAGESGYSNEVFFILKAVPGAPINLNVTY